MKLTKYQHACFTVEKEGSVIVVDPGAFSHDFIVPSHVDAIVITHEHPDHLDEAKVNAILSANPTATVIAHETIAGRFTNHTTIGAKLSEVYTLGAFSLRFFGGDHATIASTVPVPPNLGVLIDERLYYPGDSFAIPSDVQVKELALPASAPWLKISEPMDFLLRISPTFVFPTHDAILSRDGKELVDRMLGSVASGQGSTYKRLDGQSVELA